jgi:hypothetical protein
MVYKLHNLTKLLVWSYGNEMVTINSYQQPTRYKYALGIAILDVILILITLIQQLPRLQPAFLIPFPQVLMDAGSWFILAEICFYCAVLVALYGMLALWMPELIAVLWFGAGLVVGAGLLYLTAGLMYYRGSGMGVPVQQGFFMFLLSLTAPILAVRMLKRYERIQVHNYPSNPI